MERKTYQTSCGPIRYWLGGKAEPDIPELVFLPGLTADHRLFDRQVEYFQDRYRVFVWDAPGHAQSWPFQLTFSLADKARWLYEILRLEGLSRPVLIGQSMGGYVGQAFMETFPGAARGFISIDSAPLQRRYITAAELWLLKRMEPVYRIYPWKALLKSGCEGCAVSEYGRTLMREMMLVYDGDKERYARLSGHGFRILAEAIEADLPYEIPCPALLLCGEKDRAGSTKRYNRAWHKGAGIPIRWIANAGHNSNCDRPEEVNAIIQEFLNGLAAS